MQAPVERKGNRFGKEACYSNVQNSLAFGRLNYHKSKLKIK